MARAGCGSLTVIEFTPLAWGMPSEGYFGAGTGFVVVELQHAPQQLPHLQAIGTPPFINAF